MFLFAPAVTFFLLFLCEISLADQVSLPDDHPPPGVIGNHVHKAGEWMLSYRYGFMKIDGTSTARSLKAITASQSDGSFRFDQLCPYEFESRAAKVIMILIN